MYMVGLPFVLLAVVVALFLKEIPLQTRAQAPGEAAGQALAAEEGAVVY